MARYTGPACRLCRRENEKLFLKGERCLSSKCSFERRAYAPGDHGKSGSGRGSDKASAYARQLRAKQRPAALTAFWNVSSAACTVSLCSAAVKPV